MATARNLNTGVTVNGKVVYCSPTGLKAGAKGKVVPAGFFYGQLSKSDARKVRKALRLNGEIYKARAKRETV